MFFLQRDDSNSKLQEIADAIYQGIEALCLCGFGGDRITDSEFQCGTNQDRVTYRARLHATELATSQQLILHIEDWVASNVRITVQGVVFSINSTCLVSIDSFDDTLCEEPASDKSGEGESLNVAIVSGAAGGAFALVIVITIAVAIAIRVKIAKRRRTISQHAP